MGLVTSQIRYLYLTFLQHDLEYKIQLVTRTKMGLARSVSDILNVGTDLDPDSPELKLLEKRRQRLLQVEKKLDAQMAIYQGQLKAIDTEKESVKRMLEKNVKQSFSY